MEASSSSWILDSEENPRNAVVVVLVAAAVVVAGCAIPGRLGTDDKVDRLARVVLIGILLFLLPIPAAAAVLTVVAAGGVLDSTTTTTTRLAKCATRRRLVFILGWIAVLVVCYLSCYD